QARTWPDASWRDEAARGARALNSALFKVAQGEVDPRALLRRFDLALSGPAGCRAPENGHG
ncbi:general secretion pathway protein, partial [Xylella fastidiosa subsp. multiplex]|nr:general secretion pathway protein [Xylella fastidiosa subsp. multiplex]